MKYFIFESFEYTDSIGMPIFTIQGHLEVKNKMGALAILNFHLLSN